MKRLIAKIYLGKIITLLESRTYTAQEEVSPQLRTIKVLWCRQALWTFANLFLFVDSENLATLEGFTNV